MAFSLNSSKTHPHRQYKTKTQEINQLSKNMIRNVVAFELNNPTPLFSTNGRTGGILQSRLQEHLTKILTRMDVTIPLPGIIGPRLWLRTLYVDDELRITHGHKGSVFILRRTAIKS